MKVPLPINSFVPPEKFEVKEIVNEEILNEIPKEDKFIPVEEEQKEN